MLSLLLCVVVCVLCCSCFLSALVSFVFLCVVVCVLSRLVSAPCPFLACLFHLVVPLSCLVFVYVWSLFGLCLSLVLLFWVAGGRFGGGLGPFWVVLGPLGALLGRLLGVLGGLKGG